MGNRPSFQLVLHTPETAEGWEELSERVSGVRASAIFQRIQALTCPTSQKQKLLEEILKVIKEQSRDHA